MKVTRALALIALTPLVLTITSTRSTAQDSLAKVEPTADPQESRVPQSTNPFGRAVFPAKEQTAEQQLSDQLTCYDWAIDQTKWDPEVAYDELKNEHSEAVGQAEAAQGSAVRGAAGGALIGLGIGAITGDAGKGAAIGAAAGGGAGAVRSRRTRRGAEDESEAAIEAFKEQAGDWDRQWVACMEGNGYSVE